MSRLAPWVAFFVYVVLAAALTWPVWVDPAHGIVGEWANPDMISNHWLYRWIPEQLSTGSSILHNERYYVPVGDAPWLAGNGSDAVLYAPLAWLMPWPQSITAWILLTLVLNGMGGYALARRLGAKAPGALAAGAALTFSPYVALELAGARIAQAPLYWTAFFLVAWHALLEDAPTQGSWRPSGRLWRRAALAAILYGLTAFTYWYYGLWAAWIGGIFFAFRPRARALAAFVPLALATTLPPLGVFLAHWSEIPGTGETGFPHAITCEMGLPLTFPFFTGAGVFGGIALPLTLLLPAALALPWARPDAWSGRGLLDAARRTWGAMGWEQRACLSVAALFYLLCLGPYPSWSGGASSGLPGPYYAIYGLLGPLRRFWWPYRHVAGLMIALVPLAAHGIDRIAALLAAQVQDRWRGLAPLGVGVGLALALPWDLGARDATTHAPVSAWTPPAAYTALADLPGDVILELPFTPSLVGGQQTLSYQWVHHKRLLNGHALWVDRVRPAAWDAWVADNAFLRALVRLEEGEHTGMMQVRAEDLAKLQEVGLRLLVVNKEYFPGPLEPLAETYAELFGALFGAPVLDHADGLRAWDLAAYTGQTQVDVRPFRLPVDLRADRAGGLLPRVGVKSALGWTTVSRRFPPQLPLGTESSSPTTAETSP